METRLQIYTYNRKEYTVDYRMKQFRHCKGGWGSHGPITFLDFDSELGDRILASMIRKDLIPAGVSVC